MMPTLVPQVVVITTCGVTSWYHDVSRITVFIMINDTSHVTNFVVTGASAAPRVVILTTCGAINDKIVGIMMTLGVLCTPQTVYRLTLEVSLDLEKYVWPFWVTIFGKQKLTKNRWQRAKFWQKFDWLFIKHFALWWPSQWMSTYRNNDVIITSKRRRGVVLA